MRILALAAGLEFAAPAAGAGAEEANAATFRVTKTADTADGSCDADCSLREAIIAANADRLDSDVVRVPAGRYRLTIVDASTGADTAASGDLDLIGPVTIRGAGAPSTIVDQLGAEDRVFHAPPRPRRDPSTATISRLTVTGGSPELWDGGGIYGERRDATLRLIELTVRRNYSGWDASGAGIANAGTMRVDRSAISHNYTCCRSASGGGIWNRGTLTLEYQRLVEL